MEEEKMWAYFRFKTFCHNILLSATQIGMSFTAELNIFLVRVFLTDRLHHYHRENISSSFWVMTHFATKSLTPVTGSTCYSSGALVLVFPRVLRSSAQQHSDIKETGYE